MGPFIFSQSALQPLFKFKPPAVYVKWKLSTQDIAIECYGETPILTYFRNKNVSFAFLNTLHSESFVTRWSGTLVTYVIINEGRSFRGKKKKNKTFQALYELKLNVYQINFKRLNKTVEIKYFLVFKTHIKLDLTQKLFEEAV